MTGHTFPSDQELAHTPHVATSGLVTTDPTSDTTRTAHGDGRSEAKGIASPAAQAAKQCFNNAFGEISGGLEHLLYDGKAHLTVSSNTHRPAQTPLRDAKAKLASKAIR